VSKVRAGFTLLKAIIIGALIIFGCAAPKDPVAAEKARNRIARETLKRALLQMKTLRMEYGSFMLNAGSSARATVDEYFDNFFGVPGAVTSTTCWDNDGRAMSKKHWETGDWCYWLSVSADNPDEYIFAAARRYISVDSSSYRWMAVSGRGVWECHPSGNIGCE